MFNYDNYIFQVYTKELFYRFLYIFLSFVSCSTLIFWKIDVVLLIETYPFLKFSMKRFWATQVTDLIDIIWILSFHNTFLVILPLSFYHIFTFLKPSLYNYQIYVIYIFFYSSFLIFLTIFIFIYIIFLPSFFNFLLLWRINTFKNILSIKTELRILNYVNWVLWIKNFMSFIIHLFFTSLFKILIITNLNKTYFIIKVYKSQISFFLLLFLFILFPPDIYLQFILLLISFLFLEFIFLVLCYLIKNSKNVNYTTITKKTQNN